VIVEQVWDSELKSYQRPGLISGEIDLNEPKLTIFTQWGNWFVGLSMGLVFLGLIRLRNKL
jgi:hypothetical protein